MSGHNQFGEGVVAMARNCLPVVLAWKEGRWGYGDFEHWLNRVIESGPESDLLSRYKEAVELLVNLKQWDSVLLSSEQMNEVQHFLTRRDTLLATVKGES